MSEFRVGDIVAFDRHLQADSVEYDGRWTVQSVHGDAVVISRDGYRPRYASSRWLELVPPELSRMIFPFEEPEESSEWMQPLRLQRRPVVHRASSGLRKPEPSDRKPYYSLNELARLRRDWRKGLLA